MEQHTLKPHSAYSGSCIILTTKHAKSTHCTKCDTPGWGKVRVETGLTCSGCGTETKLIKHEVHGCTKCSYEETHKPSHGLEQAEPGNCQYCNP